MLNSSLSTVLMAVLTTNVLLILLSLFLFSNKLMIRVGYKLLALFAVFVLLRFLLPFEFPFTRNIHLPNSVSRMMATFYSGQLFMLGETPVTLWRIFQWVWAIGFVLGLLGYIIAYCRARHYIILYGKVVSHREPYRSLLERICREQGKGNCFTVVELPGLRSPVLFGILSPRILVPENLDVTENYMYYILRHEAAHHFHHDLILKNVVRLITLAYWWDPFCILLNKQTDAILEMRIDDCLTLTEPDATGEYLHCLVDVAERAAGWTPLPRNLTMGLFPKMRSNAWRRFTLLTSNQQKRQWPVNLALCLVTVSVFLFSYTFILESYCRPTDEIPLAPPAEENLIFLSSEDFYAIDNGNGTYAIYFKDINMEITDSLEYYPDIPIYTRENCPY